MVFSRLLLFFFFLKCVYLSLLLISCVSVCLSGFRFHLQLFFLCACVNVCLEICFSVVCDGGGWNILVIIFLLIICVCVYIYIYIYIYTYIHTHTYLCTFVSISVCMIHVLFNLINFFFFFLNLSIIFFSLIWSSVYSLVWYMGIILNSPWLHS